MADFVVVQRIRSLRARGMTMPAIAQTMTELGIPTPSGRTTWTKSSVSKLLAPAAPKPPESVPAVSGGLCAGRAPLFDDHVDGETPTARRVRLASSASLCRMCPVQPRCPNPIST